MVRMVSRRCAPPTTPPSPSRMGVSKAKAAAPPPNGVEVLDLKPPSPYRTGLEGAVELAHDDCYDETQGDPAVGRTERVSPAMMGVIPLAPPSPYHVGQAGAVELSPEECYAGEEPFSLEGEEKKKAPDTPSPRHSEEARRNAAIRMAAACEAQAAAKEKLRLLEAHG